MFNTKTVNVSIVCDFLLGKVTAEISAVGNDDNSVYLCKIFRSKGLRNLQITFKIYKKHSLKCK